MATRQEQIFNFIRRTSNIENELLEDFYNHSEFKKIKKGELIVSEGEKADRLYFLHEGVFRYYLISAEGKDITKDFAIDHENPFCMAYTSFMTNQPSEIFIEALTDAEVSIWHHSYILPLLTVHPKWLDFSRKVATGMYIRKEKKEISFMKDLATKRYQNFMLEFPTLSARIPQHYIATYLNITPETLSRIKKR